MTTEWVGTSANADIPLTRNVRRYYIPSTTHGGGGGGFAHLPAAPPAPTARATTAARGTSRANPMPSTQIINVHAPRAARLGAERHSAAAQPLAHAHRQAHWSTRPRRPWASRAAFPACPTRSSQPENFIFPVFDYDWGPQLQPQRRIGRADQPATADQGRDPDEGAAGGCRRQRNRRRAHRAARSAAGHLPRLEHHRRRLPPGPGLQLRRRLHPVRDAPRPSGWPAATPGRRWRSATAITRATWRSDAPRPTRPTPRATCCAADRDR